MAVQVELFQAVALVSMENKGVLATIKDNVIGLFTNTEDAPIMQSNTDVQMRANWPTNSGQYTEIYTQSYDGEKNLGGIGPAKQYIYDYAALRVRGWQAFVESDISPMVIRRFTTWVIGTGLKLQCEINNKALALMGQTIDAKQVSKEIEPLWKVSESTMDYTEQTDLCGLARDAYINTKIGGDVLVVLRVVKGSIKVQLVQGDRVVTPIGMRGGVYKQTGNRVVHGVEVDQKGKHIAYHIKKAGLGFETQRIAARKAGRRMAFMVYGSKDRIGEVRGIPLNSNILETLKKLDRYKEATVAGAESRSKLPFTIEYDQTSTGENPLQGQLMSAYDSDQSKVPVTADGVSKNRSATSLMENTVLNMPNGAQIKMHDSKQELNFRDFYDVNVDISAANANIPPEVARSKYDSNFSASRAALKDWEHTLIVERNYFGKQFYNPIYALWLDLNTMRGVININGYADAMLAKNEMMLSAYRTARWIGTSVPHIDPLKEVKAERAKLGPLGENVPLTTVEQSTEALNTGDAQVIAERFKDEIKGFEVEDKTSVD